MFSSDYSLGAVVGKLIVYFGVANVFCVCVNACIQEIEKKDRGDSSEGIKNDRFCCFLLVPHLKYECTRHKSSQSLFSFTLAE